MPLLAVSLHRQIGEDNVRDVDLGAVLRYRQLAVAVQRAQPRRHGKMLALRTLKMVINRGAEAPLETALELERKSYAWLRSTHDYAEGVTSFLEKRPPKYLGR